MQSKRSTNPTDSGGLLAKPWARLCLNLAVAGILFWLFVVIQNHLTSTSGSEVALAIAALVIVSLFGLEAWRNLRDKRLAWASASIIAAVLAGAGALWLFIVLEAFRGFSLN